MDEIVRLRSLFKEDNFFCKTKLNRNKARNMTRESAAMCEPRMRFALQALRNYTCQCSSLPRVQVLFSFLTFGYLIDQYLSLYQFT